MHGEERSILRRAATILEKSLEWVIISMTGITAIIIFLQVLFRYVLNLSLAWTDESSRYLFVWFSYLGASLALREGKHISVTYFVGRLPLRLQYWVALARIMIIMTYLVFVVVYGAILISITKDSTSAALQISMMVPQLSIPLAGFLLLVYATRNLVDTVRGLISKEQRLAPIDQREEQEELL